MATEILMDVERLFNSFEKRLSRFNPNSELSRLNSTEQEIFPASPTLLSVMEVALWGADVTEGLYDPTILNDLNKAGYDRSFEQITNPMPLTASPDYPGEKTSPEDKTSNREDSLEIGSHFRMITVNRSRREISKPFNVQIDLGGMGKGWTVDRAADQLQGVGPFIVNAGGDIFAYHSPPGSRGWQVDLVHPLKPEQSMAQVYLHHKALATSTIAKRRWQRNGRVMHHLIDPRTGQPADTDALSVSVIADRTVVAEILAKVVLILGVEHGLAYLERMPNVEGLIFTNDNQICYSSGFAEVLGRVEPAGYVN
jgi:thiamine biosynthesis lipoprotein